MIDFYKTSLSSVEATAPKGFRDLQFVKVRQHACSGLHISVLKQDREMPMTRDVHGN